MARSILFGLGLFLLLPTLPANAAGAGSFGLTFQDADRIRRVDRVDSIGFRVEFVENQPSPSVATWPSDATEPLPGPISALQVYVMTPIDKLEAAGIVDSCVKTLTILQARPEKYKGWMWLAIPDANRSTYDAATGVFRVWLDPGYTVACELSRTN